jgi:anthranilate synthase component 2
VLLMIDNYDSFTYNIVQYFGELGVDVKVFRNDEIGLDEIAALRPDQIVISPGPCTPKEAGISTSVITQFAGKIPLLGICLGHQSIGQVFGGQIVQAGKVMHGKIFNATRYHSLVVAKESLPDCLEVTAWTETPDGKCEEIMGIRHKGLMVEGVQFHPESILSEHGHALLKNFLDASLS